MKLKLIRTKDIEDAKNRLSMSHFVTTEDYLFNLMLWDVGVPERFHKNVFSIMVEIRAIVSLEEIMEGIEVVQVPRKRDQTTQFFWDCECKKYYIHPQTDSRCDKCGAEKGDMPDSRLGEVIKMLLNYDNDKEDT